MAGHIYLLLKFSVMWLWRNIIVLLMFVAFQIDLRFIRAKQMTLKHSQSSAALKESCQFFDVVVPTLLLSSPCFTDAWGSRDVAIFCSAALNLHEHLMLLHSAIVSVQVMMKAFTNINILTLRLGCVSVGKLTWYSTYFECFCLASVLLSAIFFRRHLMDYH